MTQDEFTELVRKLEEFAKHNPRAYKTRVFGLAAMGYGFVLAILLSLIGVSAGMVYLFTFGTAALLLKKLLIPVVILVFVVARSMWIRLPPPEGVPLKQKDFPELFKTIKTIRRKLNGPKIHRVLLVDDFNASILQVPRLGIFGWQKNFLMLGLPLMQALEPDEFIAVIGHEYGHLAGAHSKFSSWIYRVRKTWFKIMESFEKEDRWGSFIFKKFFQWYAPYFSAYSFVLARSNEYDADRASAQVTNSKAAAQALTSVYVAGSVFENTFWKSIYNRIEKEAVPGVMPFIQSEKIFHQDFTSADNQVVLNRIMQVETGIDDTHPALKNRLAGLNESPILRKEMNASAANYFLGDHWQQFASAFSESWRDAIGEKWREKHEYIQTSKKRVQEIEAIPTAQRTIDDDYDLASLCEEFFPEKDIIALYQLVLRKNSDHVSANYQVGCLLLEKGDESGITYLEKVMSLDEDSIATCCERIYYYLIDKEREKDAEPYRERHNAAIDHQKAVSEERDVLRFSDSFSPHELSNMELGDVIAQLKTYKRIGKAYLVKKVTKLSTKPLYALGVSFVWWYPNDVKDNRKLVQQMSENFEFPYECLFVVVDNDNKPLRKVFKKVNRALIYKR